MSKVIIHICSHVDCENQEGHESKFLVGWNSIVLQESVSRLSLSSVRFFWEMP